MREYLGFDVRISGSRDAGFTVHVASGGAEESAPFDFPFSDLEVENFVLKMAASGRNVRSTAMLTDERREDAEEFGTAIFDAVFDDDVRALLRSARDAAEREGKGLRMRLRLGDAPDLSQVPWEYMHGTKGDGFLALQAETPMVRYLEMPHSSQPLAVSLPLSVLVMISSPTDMPRLDVEREWNKLVEATADLRANGHLVLDRIDDASLIELQRKLRSGDVHIFHYIGHGGFDRKSDTGVLAFEGAGGAAQLVPGKDLGNVLDNASSLRLVVLNACEGARTSLEDPFAGVAQQLVERGMPAVVAMQFEITDDAALSFSEELYRTISEGLPIDEAVTHTRLSLYSGGNYAEWATPVLYMRAPDGHIFDLAATESDESAIVPPVPPPPGPLQATLERTLTRANLPLSVVVDDVEVVVEGVVDNDESVTAAHDLIAASLAAAGAGRLISMNVSSLSDRIMSALGDLVDDLEIRAGSDTVQVLGVVNTTEAAASVENLTQQVLTDAGLSREVHTQVTNIEGALDDALARAGTAAAITVTDTDVQIDLRGDSTPDEAQRVTETVLGTLGIGRMVHVQSPAVTGSVGGATAPPSDPQTGASPGDSVPIPAPSPAPVPPTARLPHGDPPLPRPQAGRSSRRGGPVIWIAAAALLAAVLAAIVLLGGGDDQGSPTTTAPPVTVTTSSPTSSSPPTTATTTPPPTTTATTIPTPDTAAIERDVTAALAQAPIENLAVDVVEGDDGVAVMIDGVVDTAQERADVASDAANAAGAAVEVDVSGVVVIEDEVGDSLASSGLGSLTVEVGAGEITVGGTSNAEDWTSIEPSIDVLLDGFGVERDIDVSGVVLPDVAGAMEGLLAAGGYEGAEVTATTELISISFRVADDGDAAAAEADISSIANAAGYPQTIELNVFGGQLPATGNADVAVLGLALVFGGLVLVTGSRRLERRHVG